MQFRLPIRWRDVALAVAVATLCACASLPSGKSGRSNGPEQPLARIKLAPTPPEHDALQSLLAGQFALAAGDLPAAARQFLRARLDDDPALAAQATPVALVAKQWDLAREDLARWRALRGEDPDIWQSRAMLAMHDGKSDAAYADLSRHGEGAQRQGLGALAQVLIGAKITMPPARCSSAW